MKNNDEVNALKYELAQLKSQFDARIKNLEFRIAQVDPEYSAPLDPVASQQVAQAPNTPVNKEVVTVHHDVAPMDVEINPTVEMPAASVVAKKSTATKPHAEPQAKPVAVKPKESKPSFVEIMFQSIMASVFDWFKPVANVYRSYKERGMLGIFVLTIMGIGLTLAGFGYLMQLLIDQMGVGLKSLLMLSAAAAVMMLGIYLKRQTKFGEFATAIVSLGILLLYSTVYFAGDVYQILSIWMIIALYLVIALAAHGLAMWLETKVVAALGIVGVSVIPLLSDAVGVHGSWYLVSLALVTLSSLILAYRYVGAWLANLSLAFVLVALEWAVSQPLFSFPIVFIDVFYLLFFGYITFNLVFKEQRQQHVMLFLAALIGANLLFFFQASDALSGWLALMFGVNGVAAIAAGYVLYRIKHPLTHFMALIATVWLVLMAVSALGGELWGVAWAVEGLLLIAIGRRYLLPSVINQGQALACVALFYSLIGVFDNTMLLPSLQSFDEWLIALTVLATLSTWLRLITDDKVFFQFTQQRVKPLLLFCESAWIALLIFSCGDMWLGLWMAPATILLQVALLFRARACGQESIEFLALSLIAVPIIYALEHAVNFGIYRFSLLPLFAKLSLASALVQLWLFAEYFRRYAPESPLRQFSEYARIAFYLIVPVCWLVTGFRRLEADVILIVWLSPLLAVCFAQLVKHKWIVWQAKILVGLASLCLIFGAMSTSVTSGLIATALFGLCYGAVYVLNQRKSEALYQYIAGWGLWTMGMMLPLAIATATDSFVVSHLVGLMYWTAMMLIAPNWWLAKRHSLMIGLMQLFYIVSSWTLIFTDEWFAIAPMVFVAATFIKQRGAYKQSLIGGWFKEANDVLLHVVVLVTYVLTLSAFDYLRLDLLIAPALAIHGAVILFTNQRTLLNVRVSFGLIFVGILKLGLLDAANAVLWQKVVLFMGIGVLILGASFWYQRLVTAQDVAPEAEEVK